MSNSLDLKHIRTTPEDYHIKWLQVDGEILRADVMRKAWWGMKYRKCGDLLSPVRDADAKIKELEAKLEGAKRDREAKLEDVKLIAKTYEKSGKVYGDVIEKNKDSKGSKSFSDAVDRVKGASTEKKKEKPKPLMAGQLKAVPNTNNNQQGKQKGNNQNH